MSRLHDWAKSQDSEPMVELSTIDASKALSNAEVHNLKHEKKKSAKKKESKPKKDKAEPKPKAESPKKPNRKTKPRPVRYRGEKPQCSDEFGCDVLTLYVGCKLGYSPIRMIMGLSTDSKIERIIYQHKLFRVDPDSHDVTDLQAEGVTKISDIYMPIIRAMVNKYNSGDHPYVIKMLKTQVWYDMDVSKERDFLADYENRCRTCSSKLDPKWEFCPKCGKKRNAEKG